MFKTRFMPTLSAGIRLRTTPLVGGVAVLTSLQLLIGSPSPARTAVSSSIGQAASDSARRSTLFNRLSNATTTTHALGNGGYQATLYALPSGPTASETSSADCWVTSAEPDTSRCGAQATWMRVGYEATGGAKRRALVKFDISAIPETARIDAVDLQLYLDASQTSNVRLTDYTIRRATRVWTNQATWNSYDGDPASPWNGGGPWSADAVDYATNTLSGQSSGYKHWSPVQLVRE